MGQNIHSMLPKQNFDKSIMSSRCPSIFCPYFWPIAWRAPQRIGGSILRRMSPLLVAYAAFGWWTQNAKWSPNRSSGVASEYKVAGNDVYAIHAQSLVVVGWWVRGDWAGRVAGAGLHTRGHGGWPHDGGVSPDIVTSRHNIAPIINLTFRPSASSDTQDIDMYCHKWQVSFILPSQWPEAQLSLFKIHSFCRNCLPSLVDLVIMWPMMS